MPLSDSEKYVLEMAVELVKSQRAQDMEDAVKGIQLAVERLRNPQAPKD